ncbi:MAG: hypothetical protein SZ59_C0002G0169 [candidate division TM6 bacterium GW2011_GWF2_28_16]|nr:MAG: hypothetical protein SZ59_C0002G0169 [candidate division TM6 bacterium GW2011_GWF2_28_16]
MFKCLEFKKNIKFLLAIALFGLLIPFYVSSMERFNPSCKKILKNEIPKNIFEEDFAIYNGIRYPIISSGTEKFVYEYGSEYVLIKYKELYDSKNKIYFSNFSKELSCLINLEHENIIKLIGCNEPDKILIEERASFNLNSFLSQSKSIGPKTKTKIAKDIASGLAYMHANDFVHRDLKLENIVIFEQSKNGKKYVTAKIIDFGYSNNCFKDSDYSKNNYAIGTIFYVDPRYWELYRVTSSTESQNIEYHKYSDIFAFGILMYEIFYQLSVCEYYNSNVFSFNKKIRNMYSIKSFDFRKQVYVANAYVDENWRPPLDDEKVDPKINDLIKRCWDNDPEKRPTAEQIVIELQDYFNELNNN